MQNETLHQSLTEQGISFTIGAPIKSTLLRSWADLLIEPERVDQLPGILLLLMENGRSYHAHGGGSNTLFTGTREKPCSTVIIDTSALDDVTVDKAAGSVTAHAGSKIARVSQTAADHSLTGLEFAIGIPGTTAGAIVTAASHPLHSYHDLFQAKRIEHQNLPRELRQVLKAVTIIDGSGQLRVKTTPELEMDCRRSIFTTARAKDWFTISAVIGLAQAEKQLIDGSLDVIREGRARMRQRNQDKFAPSTRQTLGYTFVLNHPTYKGRSACEIISSTNSIPQQIDINGMGHSQETPNIVCNMSGKGTPDGYLRVMDTIQEAVLREQGIELPIEVDIVQ